MIKTLSKLEVVRNFPIVLKRDTDDFFPDWNWNKGSALPHPTFYSPAAFCRVRALKDKKLFMWKLAQCLFYSGLLKLSESPRFKRRRQRPHLSMGGVSKILSPQTNLPQVPACWELFIFLQ